MKASKSRTLKKVLLNIVAVLCVVMITGNVIATACAVQIHGFLGTEPTKYVLEDGTVVDPATMEYKRYFTSEYTTVAELKAAGEALVKEVEAEGIVLLKNEGVLPLPQGSEVALVGMSAVFPVYGGTGSGAVDAAGAPDFRKALETSGFTVVNEPMLQAYIDEHGERPGGYIGEMSWSWLRRKSKNDDGDYTVGNGEHIVFVIGRTGGEGNDLNGKNLVQDAEDYLSLNEAEIDILESLAEMKDEGEIASITVIINSANPISVGFINDEDYAIDAALWVGSMGQTGVYAVGDVLSGAVNPSGSLPDTWWVDNQLNPVTSNFGAYSYTSGTEGLDTAHSKYVVYQEGIYLGYKYTETRYEDVVLGTPNAGDYDWADVVAYPFGYGMSYTSFAMTDMKVEKTGTGMETEYVVSVNVTNTGDVAGKKTVQVYAQKPYTDYDREHGIEKASAELVGYGKTTLLAPGASETVTVTVPEYFLTSYDATGTGVFILSEGTHYLTVADDSHEAVNNILAVKGKTTADGMTSEGDATLVHAENYTFDATTYAKAYGTGNDVTSLFDEADVNRYAGRGDNSVVYYSRSDWAGTVTNKTVQLYMTPEMRALSVLDDADLPAFTEADEWPVMGERDGMGIQLIHMRGVAFDDPQWETFMDQLTFDELAAICARGLRMTAAVASIGKPQTLDHNGPSGVTQAYTAGTNGYAVQTNDPNKTMKGTAFPCNGIVAATFNDELVYRVGKLIGEDAMWAGYAGLYGSGLNIHRSPYSGRVFEYYSEDGILTGLIDTVETKGIQEKGVYVYNKHFVLNDQENNRAGIATWCNEQALREIYLRAFELPIVNADAKCVMTAYNRLGQVWAGAYRELLEGWLRGEAGMDGFAVTDMYDNTYMVKVHEVLAGNDIPDDYADNLGEFTPYGPGGAKANPIVAQHMRLSSKRVLYIVANSRGMDGIDESIYIVENYVWWQMALDIAQWTLVGLTVLFGALFLLDIGKEKCGGKCPLRSRKAE